MKGNVKDKEYVVEDYALRGRWQTLNKKMVMDVELIFIDKRDNRRAALIGDVSGNDEDIRHLEHEQSKYGIAVERSREIYPGRMIYYGRLWAESYYGTVFVHKRGRR